MLEIFLLNKMALENYIDISDFIEYTGMNTNQINNSYLDFLINSINSTIEKELGDTFSLVETSINYRTNNSDHVVIIKHWQDPITSIVIKNDYDSTTENLKLGEDYTVFKLEVDEFNSKKPIVAVNIFRGLTEIEYITITGTYGYSEGIPSELMFKDKIYNLIEQAIYAKKRMSETSGGGLVTSTKSDYVSVTFDTSKAIGISETINSISKLINGVKRRYAVEPYMFTSII